jgi:beta-glucosidase
VIVWGRSTSRRRLQISYDEGLKVGYKWYDAEKKPALFPFGFGLSYNTYAYSRLSVTAGDPATVSFTVKNTGSRAEPAAPLISTNIPVTTCSDVLATKSHLIL